MADILIKGIQIPKNCNYCNADLAYAAHCIMVQRIVLPSEYDVNERHPSCPLRDVPPHGDLIDRDDLPLPAPIEDEYKRVHEIVKNAPVILPASGEAPDA